ncbi:MAG: molybdate ABC transporter substrate-binding protein [Pseudomonadota bacterium]
MKIFVLFQPLIISLILMFFTGLFSVGQAKADNINVAVASNFTDAIKSIVKNFEVDTGHKVTLIFGSTGKHYAQIINGAPFDIFFAADTKRPKLLDKAGIAQSGSRFTYAMGKLVLWSPKPGYVDKHGNVLGRGNFRHLAIASPKLAPYGRAAQEILQERGLWDSLRLRMVRGENIGQTFNFVKSGNVDLGFVAYSQVKRPNQPITGSFWQVPETLYSPIEQQVILLKDNKTARALLSFVKSKRSLEIIRGFGYGTP